MNLKFIQLDEEKSTEDRICFKILNSRPFEDIPKIDAEIGKPKYWIFKVVNLSLRDDQLIIDFTDFPHIAELLDHVVKQTREETSDVDEILLKISTEWEQRRKDVLDQFKRSQGL